MSFVFFFSQGNVDVPRFSELTKNSENEEYRLLALINTLINMRMLRDLGMNELIVFQRLE